MSHCVLARQSGLEKPVLKMGFPPQGTGVGFPHRAIAEGGGFRRGANGEPVGLIDN